MICGLLGRNLAHSYSPAVHALLGDYEYRLFERSEAELPAFLASGEWDGLNVTIPYKKAVVPFCAELSEAARRTGSVNTLLRRADGTILGDNTDVAGFRALVESSGIAPEGKPAVVLGSGGASAAVCAALAELGVEPVVISRRGADNYGNLRRRDTALVVNATPVGMYPDNGSSPVDLREFPACEAVFDLIYNPARTALLLQAEALGIPGFNGLRMLTAQARASAEGFTGRAIPAGEAVRIADLLAGQMRNIVLIGMPGCGKSTLAALLGRATGRPVFDADEVLAGLARMPAADYLTRNGEAAFRRLETEVLTDLGKTSGAVIATGGGCVTRPENYPLLHQNGILLWLRRDAALLPREGRPLSLASPPEALLRAREPLYRRFADAALDNDGAPEETLRRILEVIA